jgi:ribosome-associated toxin RatA of RatAB toxin-antitoxin module
MNRTNEITIDGDLMNIYRLGAEIENWPKLLPHYRSVDVFWQDGNRMVAKMAASRDGIPVSWLCYQERFPDVPLVTFRHIGGFTRGMQVSWTFQENPDDTVTVRIHHEFRKGWPVMNLDRWVSEKVVGEFFVHNIAGKTLAQIKLLAESDRASHRGVEVIRIEDLDRLIAEEAATSPAGSTGSAGSDART